MALLHDLLDGRVEPPGAEPRVMVDVVPCSGIVILPFLKLTNSSDSGAPPEPRISAGVPQPVSLTSTPHLGG